MTTTQHTLSTGACTNCGHSAEVESQKLYFQLQDRELTLELCNSCHGELLAEAKIESA